MVPSKPSVGSAYSEILRSHSKTVTALLFRILRAADYVSIPGNHLPHQRRRVRLSKSGAVLVGFFIFHSFPNVLLTTTKGRQKYSKYGSYHSSSPATKLVEAFLLSAALTHALLGTHKAYSRWRGSVEVHTHGRTGEMMLTGSVILGLLVSHLFDFRLNPNEDEVHLDRQVMELLDQRHRRVKNALYWLMVLAVSVHAWRGNTKAWMYRLGFRGDREISLLHRLCQVLILVSAGLYSIPLAMKNPYSQSTEFMAGPRIITVA